MRINFNETKPIPSLPNPVARYRESAEFFGQEGKDPNPRPPTVPIPVESFSHFREMTCEITSAHQRNTDSRGAAKYSRVAWCYPE